MNIPTYSQNKKVKENKKKPNMDNENDIINIRFCSMIDKVK